MSSTVIPVAEAGEAVVLEGVRVRHIFLSPGHNFRGHHGGPAGTNETVEVERAECVPGQGLKGDRYAEKGEGHKGQVTFFDWQVYLDLCEQFGLNHPSPGVFRRNVVVEGADLPSLIGKRFTLQGVTFEGAQDCAPCYWMDQAFAPGAEEAMRGRGGLRARILTGGTLVSSHPREV
jgi:MOSC domain-containing protein YiiM